jgi:hypothetical protein
MGNLAPARKSLVHHSKTSEKEMVCLTGSHQS